MKKYTVPTESYEPIRLIREHYKNTISSNNVELLANESKGLITLNRKTRLEKDLPNNQIPSINQENRMRDRINAAEQNNNIKELKNIYTTMYNELIEAITYDNFKAKMLFREPITLDIKQNDIDIWNADTGEVERSHKKKIVKSKRKIVKKTKGCRCK